MRAAQQAARDAEHRFPVRIRIGIPPEGLGNRLDQMNAWLDANCGADGWTSTPSSTRGVVNDALAICFADATLASAFVARWCAMQRVEIVDGVYQVRMTSRRHGSVRLSTGRLERPPISVEMSQRFKGKARTDGIEVML